MWLLTSSGSVLVLDTVQGETTRAQLDSRVWPSNGTSNWIPCKVVPKASERISDGLRIVSSEVLVIKKGNHTRYDLPFVFLPGQDIYAIETKEA